jgi:hypothetical protein
MFDKKRKKIEETMKAATEAPIETTRKPLKRCEVVCETTPYTLLNIIARDKYGDIDSYFEFIFISEYGSLNICNTKNHLNTVYMTLSENEKPYVEDTHCGHNLYIPKNSIIKKVVVGGNSVKSESSDDGISPLIAGSVGLATGLVLGSNI